MKNTDITLERSGNIITVTGIFNNEKIETTIKINELPWHQELNTGFSGFIISDKESALFWMVDGSSMKKAFGFKLEKNKIETIELNGRNTESVKTWLGPSSKILKLIWEGGTIWFRKSDGISVRRIMNPKKPDDISQLIEEK
jgi:hypothetical protein